MQSPSESQIVHRVRCSLSKNSKVIVNTQQIHPLSVTSGQEEYPEGIVEQLKERGIETFELDAFGIAREVGELRTVNLVLVGALSAFLPATEDMFMEVIRTGVKKDFVDVNIEAFKRGRAVTG